MTNILVNFSKANAGGGENIMTNFIQKSHYLSERNTYFIITPSKKHILKPKKKNIHFIKVPEFYLKNIWFPFLYYYYIPRIIRKNKINVIFNFGDVIIPSKLKQIYFFDWAYAVYNESYIWNQMNSKDRFIRKIKVFLIDKKIRKIFEVIAQNSNIQRRLQEKYGLNNIHVIPTPVDITGSQTQEIKHTIEQPIQLLYPSSYSTHKNFNILLEVGKLIKSENLLIKIFLTIDYIQGKEFLRSIKEMNLEKHIINLGTLNRKELREKYQECSAVIMPTLLESYGLPYFEAMSMGKPILTSNLDFALEACGQAAIYFDPFDAVSILNSIKETFSNPERINDLVKKGNIRLKKLPSWENVIKIFEFRINELLKNN